jgi:hypothetical protein
MAVPALDILGGQTLNRIGSITMRRKGNIGYGDRSMIEIEFLRLQGKIWGE